MPKFTDNLTSVEETGFSTAWDWKGQYVTGLRDDGYERFSQLSASPDTTLLYAGPARFTGLSGNTGRLFPIGLADGFQYSDNAQLTRLFEIGSNRSFFTRGKSAPTLGFQKMLADQANILNALRKNALEGSGGVNAQGYNAPGASSPNEDIMMNLGSEYFSIPFGMLIVFKAKGGDSATSTGKVLSASYLEYCMFRDYNFQLSSGRPVIQENVSIEFDRPVPVSFN